jgi:hypothetical protein
MAYSVWNIPGIAYSIVVDPCRKIQISCFLFRARISAGCYQIMYEDKE